jgi:hypothetical protein
LSARPFFLAAGCRRGDLTEGPTEHDWNVIEAVARTSFPSSL